MSWKDKGVYSENRILNVTLRLRPSAIQVLGHNHVNGGWGEAEGHYVKVGWSWAWEARSLDGWFVWLLESQSRMTGIMVDKKTVIQVPEPSVNESDCEARSRPGREGAVDGQGWKAGHELQRSWIFGSRKKKKCWEAAMWSNNIPFCLLMWEEK